MKANLAHGRIAGIPATGGYISLDHADGTSLVQATSGLVREVVNSGLKIGAAGLGLYFLAGLLSKSDKNDASRDTPEDSLRKIQAIKNTEPTHWGGICLVSGGGHHFHGILLDDHIMCKTSDGQLLTIPTDRILTLKHHRYEMYTLALIDGSFFIDITMSGRSLRFATLAGVIEVNPYRFFNGKFEISCTEIQGVNRCTAEMLKEHLVKHLSATRLDIFEEFGLDLVRKYFYLEADEQQVAKQATAPATPVLEVILTDHTLATMVARVSEGHLLTVDFGQTGADATITLNVPEGVEPFRVQLSVRDGFLCIVGTNLIVQPLTMDGLHPKEPLMPTDNVWRLDCRQHSHVVTLNNSGVLTVHPRST